MLTVGDDVAGFSAELEEGLNSIRVIGRGFWSADVARAIAPKVRELSSEHPRVTEFVFDMRDLKPMRDEGQQSFLEIISWVGHLRNPKMRILTSSPLTKLQFLRIVRESGAGDWIEVT
ncbi:MAG TPA: hypothetical protein VFQ61_02360 [Polyangiaceae bacterium]|nr:hypothetical protein [Polyangiaceae bacterium]